MNWYNKSKNINEKIKNIIRSSDFFSKLFKKFHVNMDKINTNLTFFVKDLDKIYAKGNKDYIFINSRLLNDSNDLQDKIHYIVHEIVHWLTRQREKEEYFQDPEERDSFLYGILYELLRNKSIEDIYKTFYPIISGHFEKKEDSKKVMKALLLKALSKVKDFE